MLENLIEADRRLFSIINGHNDSIVDFVMYWATDKWIWIPFYAWLLYMLYKIYKKDIIWIILIVTLMIIVSDQTSVFIKNYVERLRPCHDSLLSETVHLVNNSCGGKYGFLSSHAANSMSLAFFTGMLLPAGYRWMLFELIGYVLLIGYSRIYLAAHFPGDIIAGWLLGLIVGFAGCIIFRKFILHKRLLQ